MNQTDHLIDEARTPNLAELLVAKLQSPCARQLFSVTGLFLVVALVATGGEPRNNAKDQKVVVTITPTSPRGAVFGDAESVFRFKVETTGAVKGRLVWRLAAGSATVKAGEVELIAKAGAATDTPITIAIPPLKDGVVLPTKLTVSVFESDQKKPCATFEQDLWIFPHDPFTDRSEWLKKLKLSLFDSKGDTEKVFTEAKLPFEEIKSVDSLAELKEGLVIVGEGVSFKDEKGLSAVLKKLAAEGLTVLILAPSDGEVLIPGLGVPTGGLEELTFRREIVRKLDKRLDSDGWLPDGKAIASSLTVKMGEDAVAGEVTSGPAGWTWVESRDGSGKVRWAYCGMAVIAKWKASPTPRFLFTKMLEYLSN